MVLLVLLLGVGQLLDVSLSLAQILLSVSEPPVLSVELRLELPDPGLHGGDGLLAALERVLLGLVAPVLGVLALGLEQLVVTLQGHGGFLLAPAPELVEVR